MIMNSTKPFVTVILLLFFCIILLDSCKKPEEPQPTSINLNYFHGGLTKTWRLAEYYVNGVNYPVPEWAADNVLVFNRDGSGMWIFGEVDKDPTDTIKCDHFTWTFSMDSLTIYDHNSSPDASIRKAFPVIDAHMLVEQSKSASGDVFRYVYVDAVIPNPEADIKNKHLTNGLTKIWRVREVTWDNGSVWLPEWRKDDLWLFNTDGTGWYTLGENVEFPGDTTNNDRFLWWFSNNETRLEVEEFTTSGMILIADCNILTLSDTLMIIEEQVFYAGAMWQVRVTRVPAVK